jgi:hypothetical protein
MQCKGGCISSSCCAKRILELQAGFEAQRSVVQEVIEEVGHLCLFLPKFHCELNYIEFFWGAVKRWLRDNCDYTFQGLQENLPKAMKAVELDKNGNTGCIGGWMLIEMGYQLVMLNLKSRHSARGSIHHIDEFQSHLQGSLID